MLSSLYHFITGTQDGVAGKVRQYRNMAYTTTVPATSSMPSGAPCVDGLTVDPVPSYAGSVGLIYIAVDDKGGEWCVKVAKPHIHERMQGEVAWMAAASAISGMFNSTLPQTIARTSEAFLQELDFLHEVRMWQRLNTSAEIQRSAYVDKSHVDVARSNSNQIVYRYVAGVPLSSPEILGKIPVTPLKNLINCLLCMMHFESTVFADANAGNFIYNATTQTLTMIDYGAASVLTESMKSFVKDIHFCGNDRKRLETCLEARGSQILIQSIMPQINQFWNPSAIIFQSVKSSDVTLDTLTAAVDEGFEVVVRIMAQIVALLEYLQVCISTYEIMQYITDRYVNLEHNAPCSK